MKNNLESLIKEFKDNLVLIALTKDQRDELEHNLRNLTSQVIASERFEILELLHEFAMKAYNTEKLDLIEEIQRKIQDKEFGIKIK